MGGGFKTLSSKEKEEGNGNAVNYNTTNDQVDIELNSDKDDDQVTKKEDKFELLQLKILVFLYLEKFVEIMIVFWVTATAITWKPMRDIVEILFWPLLGLVFVSGILLTICYRLNWFRQFPGFILYKILWLIFLFAIFLILGIHVPFVITFLDPYFALVALGSIAATYLFFAMLIVTHKHLCKVHAQGYSAIVYALCILAGILLVNQPLYLYGGEWHSSHDYQDFMLNIGAGILVSLIFSYETLFIYRKFVASNKLDEFLDSKWLLPGLVTVYFARDKMQLYAF